MIYKIDNYMDDKTKMLNVLNWLRSELATETNRKMDRNLNYEKIILLQKIIQKLI